MIDTFNYMIAGYIVILGGLLAYCVSLIIRFRKISREETYLDERDD